jgi:hypothetical protein
MLSTYWEVGSFQRVRLENNATIPPGLHVRAQIDEARGGRLQLVDGEARLRTPPPGDYHLVAFRRHAY